MHLRDQEKIQERIRLELDTGLIAKILFACLVVGGAIFYVGISVGQGEVLPRLSGTTGAGSFDELLSSVSQVAPAAAATRDDALMTFPTVLARRTDREPASDSLATSLREYLPESRKSLDKKLVEFEEVKAFEILARKHGLELKELNTRPTRKEIRKLNKFLLENPIPAPYRPRLARAVAPMSLEEFTARELPEEQLPVAEPAHLVSKKKKKNKNQPALGKYTLQLYSFRSKEEAESFAGTMEERGHHPFIQKVHLRDMGIFYRVRLGRFMKMTDAQKFKADFEEKEGFSTQVRKL